MTDKEKKEICKQILNNYSMGETIDIEDFIVLMDIFKNHDEWKQKNGCGILNIFIGKSKYGTRCFMLNRYDGTTTDISYYCAIKPRTDKQKIELACRSAVENVTIDFQKTVNFGVDRCPFTSEILTKQNTHIDHYNLTFAELLKIWLKDKDKKHLVSKINKTEDNNTQTYFTDQNIVADFVEFHNENTHLRAVSKTANLSILR